MRSFTRVLDFFSRFGYQHVGIQMLARKIYYITLRFGENASRLLVVLTFWNV